MTLLLLLACTDPGSGPPPVADDPGGDTGTTPGLDDAVIDAILAAARADLRAANATGASIAVWKEGEVVWADGMGRRNPDTDEDVLTTTLFQIGSDTKKIAAMAVLQQVEAGALSLDDTLGDVVPDLVFAADGALAGELTLHELLSHQSGLYDYTPWTDAPDDSDLRDRTLGRFAENEYAMGPSGLYWSYANPNFSLAGLVVEEVTGRAWGDVVEEDVFAPLGLTRTFARKADVAADGDHAVGFGLDFPDGYDTFDLFATPEYTWGTVPMEDTDDCGFTRPAGLVWSTASDMARLAGFLVDGDTGVLSDELRAQLTTAHVPLYPATEPALLGYGYGLMVNSTGWNGIEGYYDGVPLWSHGGNTMTMTSTFYVLPEQRVAVVVLSNGYGDDFTLTAVTAMEAVAALPEPGEAGSWLEEPSDLEELAGTWEDPHAVGRVTISWDGESLLVDAPDLEALGLDVGPELEPYAKDLFLLTVDGATYDLNLYRDEDGGAWLVNRQFTVGRVAETTSRPPPPPAATRRALTPSLDPRAPMARLMGR